MLYIKPIIIIFIFGFFSFTQYKEETGKELFVKNCSSCHAPMQALTAPPFQKIRDDYGLNWTVEFVTNPNKLIKERDAKALYGLHRFGLQLPCKDLSKEDIAKILDYVDSFPYDSSNYLYRKLSDKEKMYFVDSIQSEQKKEGDKFNQKKPLVDRVSHASGYISYGVDTIHRNKTKKPIKKKNGR